jgi:hypothetical protein
MATLICPDLFPRFSNSGVCPSIVGYRPGLTLKNAMACYWKAKKWSIVYSASFPSAPAGISGSAEILVGIRKSAFSFEGILLDSGQFFSQGQVPQSVSQLVCYPGKPKPPQTSNIYIKDADGNYPALPEWGPFLEGTEYDDLGNAYEIRIYYEGKDFIFSDRQPRPDEPPAASVSVLIEGLFGGGSREYNNLFFNGPYILFDYSGGIGQISTSYGNVQPSGTVAGEIVLQLDGVEIGRANLYNYGLIDGTASIVLNAIEFFSY